MKKTILFSQPISRRVEISTLASGTQRGFPRVFSPAKVAAGQGE
jgi:hypothetical protein